MRNAVLTLLFVFHIAHRKAAGKRRVYHNSPYCSVSIKKIKAGNRKKHFNTEVERGSRENAYNTTKDLEQRSFSGCQCIGCVGHEKSLSAGVQIC